MRSSRIGILAVAMLAVAARAETLRYSLDVPAGDSASFEVPFEVAFPGTLEVQATWDGPRVLSFRVDGPGVEGTWRRTGPSPQTVRIPVDDARVASGRSWKLTIRALPDRQEASGSLRIVLPDSAATVAARERAAAPPPSPRPVPNPWTVPSRPPEGASARLVSVWSAIEPLRALVYEEDPFTVRDGCGWQDELVRWLNERRDRLAEGGEAGSVETLRYLSRLADAVDTVAELTTTTNPILAGPVPDEPLRRRAWLAARKEQLQPIERELDRLAELLRDGHVPELEDRTWVPRYVACLTQCERHFEARVRAADESGATEGVDRQWPRIRAAAAAFRALSAP